MQIVIVAAETIISVYFLLVILKTDHANRRSFTFPASAFFFTADAKFLTSFLTISIIALWHDADRTFFVLFNIPSFLLLIGSSSKGVRHTSIGSETFFVLNMPWSSEKKTLFPKIWAWCHHTARQNTAQGCKKCTFGRRASGSKRLLSSLLKC